MYYSIVKIFWVTVMNTPTYAKTVAAGKLIPRNEVLRDVKKYWRPFCSITWHAVTTTRRDFK